MVISRNIKIKTAIKKLEKEFLIAVFQLRKYELRGLLQKLYSIPHLASKQKL